MVYKMVMDIGKLCASVAGSAIRHSDLITAEMTEMWRDRLAEGEIPNLRQIQTFVAEDLREIHGQLTADSRQLDVDLTETRKGRLARDGALVASREQLFAARKVLDAIFGPGGADVVFMKPGSQVAMDPVAVHEQTVVVARNLTDPGFALPELRLDVGVDLALLAERIRVPGEALGAALDELNLANPKTHASFEAKDRSFGKLSKRAIQGARLLEAIYAYAGHEGIASRTRRSSHTSRRPDTPATEPVDGTPDGGAPGGGTPPVAAPSSAPAPRLRHIPPATRQAVPVDEEPASPVPVGDDGADIFRPPALRVIPSAAVGETEPVAPAAVASPPTDALPEMEIAA